MWSFGKLPRSWENKGEIVLRVGDTVVSVDVDRNNWWTNIDVNSLVVRLLTKDDEIMFE